MSASAHVRTKALAKLVTAAFPVDQIEAVDKQTRDILQFHVADFTAHRDFESQMQLLARDCYIQGLLDGASPAIRDALQYAATDRGTNG